MELIMQMGEFGSLIVSIFLGIFFLYLVFRIIYRIRDRKLLQQVTSPGRGTKSERQLILKLIKNGIPVQTIFHDLLLEKRNGEFSQIDVVVVTTEGIIVIEVKDYSGWIFGNANHTHWTQVLAYGQRKYRFYNPIKQNNGHITTIRKQIRQFENIPFYSMIVFYGDCELKEINYVPNGTFLVKNHRLLEVFKLIKSTNEPAPYTNKSEVVQFFQRAVQFGDNPNNQSKHIKDIKDLIGKDRIFD